MKSYPVFWNIQKKYRKIFAIPDIHGEHIQLCKLLTYLFKIIDLENDLVVFLGDMIDRQDGSRKVINLVRHLLNKYPDTFVSVRGNHENFMKSVVSGDSDPVLWCRNGGVAVLKGYGYSGELKKDSYSGYSNFSTYKITKEEEFFNIIKSKEVITDAEFLSSLPLAIIADGYFFSHAPVPRDIKRNGPRSPHEKFGYKGNQYTEFELTWHYLGIECERRGAYMDVHEGPRSEFGSGRENLHGVCGHLHRVEFGIKDIRKFPNYTMLDAGCGCDDDSPLILYECKSREYWKFFKDKPLKESVDDADNSN